MAYTELDLAQAERRVLAGERCVARQREILRQHIATALPTEGPLRLLADFEVKLSTLRSARNYIRAQIAAATTQRLMQSFWALPAKHRQSLTAR